MEILDALIKQYADTLYEKALAESAATLRTEQTQFLLERARTQNQRQLYSGIEFQEMVKIYAAHIERSVAARLESYQKAFGETSRLPTEEELREIINDCRGAWELKVRHSNQALAQFLATRNAPAGLDLHGNLRAASAQGHDHMLQEWKVWRGRVLLKKSIERPSPGVMAGIPAPDPTIQQSERLTGANQSKNAAAHPAANLAFISYSWDDEAHREWGPEASAAAPSGWSRRHYRQVGDRAWRPTARIHGAGYSRKSICRNRLHT